MITNYCCEKKFLAVSSALHATNCRRVLRNKKARLSPGFRMLRPRYARRILYACAASAFTRAVSRETFREAVFL